MDPVVHFELPGIDLSRMRNFYESVFDWKTTQLGEEYGNYVTVQTCPTDSNNMITQYGSINGGFYKRTEGFDASSQKIQSTSLVIQVSNIDESLKKVSLAGGKIESKPTEMPGIGIFSTIFDTEGNRISVLQSLKK